MKLPKKITAEFVDKTVEEFETAQLALANAEAKAKKELAPYAAEFDQAKEKLLLVVETFGQVPPKAEKSKKIAGLGRFATVTYGHNTSVDEKAVQKFEKRWIEEGRSESGFAMLFQSQPKYTIALGAGALLKTWISEGTPKMFAKLFAACFTITDKAPSLKIGKLKASQREAARNEASAA